LPDRGRPSLTAPTWDAVTRSGARLTASDNPAPGTFEAIYAALEAYSRPVIGPAQPRLLTIPIHDDEGAVAGGLWGYTLFGWLHVQMLFVPDCLRDRGVGAALMAAAEQEARARGCHGAHVDTFSFQAVRFYQKLGFSQFDVLDNYPPGHARLFFCKQFEPPRP
jgi:GNAT superfamily N-acetyltransferase